MLERGYRLGGGYMLDSTFRIATMGDSRRTLDDHRCNVKFSVERNHGVVL